MIIVYNRVPKCGSSLMNTLLAISSDEGRRYRFIQSEDYAHFRVSLETQRKISSDLLVQTENNFQRAVVYERHLYFVNFQSKEKVIFHYINQIRDPLTRVLSTYDYIRYACHVHGPNGSCPLGDRKYQNLSMEQCVQTGDPNRCLSPEFGVLSAISFFCGQSAICDVARDNVDREAALTLAKINVERHYSFIGVLEYLESSLELLEYTQPNLFKGILDNYRIKLNSSAVHETPRSFRHPISGKTRRLLIKLLKYEYDLYYFIRQRFMDQYSRMFHYTPRLERR